MVDKNTGFHQQSTVNARGTLLDLSVPKVMGILNCTPDSFYDGGVNNNAQHALDSVARMLDNGAAIIDVGAYSSRPGADDISPAEERDRLLPILTALIRAFPGALFSVDTFRSEIAAAALDAGAAIVNDITGGDGDPAMYDIVARYGAPYVLMHMKGTPRTMTQQAHYGDIIKDLADYFELRINRLHSAGVKDIILDPGFGFAKTRIQSFELINRMEELKIFGLAILAGVSRKSMIYKFLEVPVQEAMNGTTVLNTVALMKGAKLLRVHDVKEAVEAVKLVEAINSVF